ncbi:MAG TPA: hypothetical protein VJ772_06030 [Nitrososphaeraceae archaeon]|nr:hypothetical protein [Nitrososphaeraceae archaeon]
METDIDQRQKLEQVITEVKVELQNMFIKKKTLIIKLGQAYEKVEKKEDICLKIKNALKNEIAKDLISSKVIERYCLPEWKKKRRPERAMLEKDKTSLSEIKQTLSPIVIDYKGKVVEDNNANWSDEGLSNQNQVLEEVDLEELEQSRRRNNNCMSFDLYFQYNEMQNHMAREFKEHKGTKPICIHVTIDITTGKIVATSLNEETDHV